MKARLLVIGTIFLALASVPQVSAQRFQELFAFQGFGTNGDGPWGGLVQATDSYFYGSTFYGGTWDFGTVFRMTADGVLTTLASFDGVTNDQHPYTTMVEWVDRNFYGVTYPNGFFRVTPSGSLTGSGGGGSQGYKFSQGTDGYLYGAYNGDSYDNYGTLFRFRPDAREGQTLHRFAYSRAYEGLRPCGSPIQANDGNFYGVTTAGGAYGSGYGVLYRVTTNGHYTVLYSFNQSPTGDDALWPCGPLLQASDGYLYGVAHGGYFGSGSIFRATTNGVVTTLASFRGSDGDQPNGALIEGKDGNFYGTCAYGGAGGGAGALWIGTVFRMTPEGVITALVSFSGTGGPFPGANPRAGLVQGSDGNLYGTTSTQGSRGAGNASASSCPGRS